MQPSRMTKRKPMAATVVAVLAILATAAPPAGAQSESFLAGGGETECVGSAKWTFSPPLPAPGGGLPASGTAKVNYHLSTCATQNASVWFRNRWDPAPRPVPVVGDGLPYETDLWTQTYDYFGDCRHAYLIDGTGGAVGQVVARSEAHITLRRHPYYPMVGHSTEGHVMLPAAQTTAKRAPGETAGSVADVDVFAPCEKHSSTMVWTFTYGEAATP